MEINFTLIVQMVVFAAFVWFTMKFVWPPLSRALEERQDKIADGLAAAERGRKELELAQQRIQDELQQAKTQAADILEKANKRGAQIVEEAREDARLEADKIAKNAKEQIKQEVTQAKEALRKQVAHLAVASAEKILKREIDDKNNQAFVDQLIEEI